jgi:GLPGLI family protein
MNKFLALILVLSFNTYSQKKNSIITYSVSTVAIQTANYFKGKEENQELKKMANSFLNNNEEVICQLYFNDKEAVFFKSRKLNTPNKTKKLIDILIGNEMFYSNSINKTTLIQKQFGGELFLIESNFFNWELTQETRLINNYTCYEAIGVKISENSNGVFKNPIVAWYTPEIPINFGPKEFCGLPGAIIELNDNKLLYVAKKIELNTSKKIKIKKPTKGKIMNEIEFDSLAKQLFYERF